MKKKIFVISDHPLSPSGVGTQTKYMIEGLLATGEYSFICLGGAIKHQDYSPIKIEGWGDDWVIYPVDGYGTHDMIRSILRTERPDALWFMTDPRFFTWLWEIEHEIRPLVPMIYYHVWDNYPYPTYNKNHYNSTDLVVAISKVTDDIVKTVAPNVDSIYHPHAVNDSIFRPISQEDIDLFREEHLPDDVGKTLFFWNNRNARRKQSGSLIFWFKAFLDKVGHDKAVLLMHTDVKDQHGQDLKAIIESLGLVNGEVKFSTSKIPAEHLSMLYNAADCTINISDAEGFGLSTLESLSCGTPIIATMTGGLQEQVTDGESWFGVGLEPASKAVIGSQEIPFIYEDRVCEKDVVAALEYIHNLTPEERRGLGAKGREHIEKNYSFSRYVVGWKQILDDAIEKYGSWDTRKGYKSWELREV